MGRLISILGVLVIAAGCDADDARPTADTGCNGAKCDLPDQDPDTNCEQRRSEVLESSQRAFTEDAVRWACADVAGVNTVNTDDRGQEYCEYYAIFAPTGPAFEGIEPTALGRQRSAERGDVTRPAVCVEGDDRSACGVTITEEALFTLEDEPDQVVGSCVFSSWHSDVPGPLPVCKTGDCPEIHGFPMSEEFARMKLATNSNATAADVVQFCVDASDRALPGDYTGDPDDPYGDAFYRGCRLTALFELEWRRSDPAICAAANRMVECGCALDGVERDGIGASVVPPQPRGEADGDVSFRGFGLGSWRSAADLPPGCEAIPTGEAQTTLVRCDLLAADVLESLGDPKEACRQVYGGQIVAHAPIPVDRVTCSGTTDAAGASCGSMPWNIGREG